MPNNFSTKQSLLCYYEGMKIKIEKKIGTTGGALLLPVFEDFGKQMPKAYEGTLSKFILKRSREEDFKAKRGEKVSTYFEEKSLPAKVAFFGAGSAEKFSAKFARELGAAFFHAAKHLKAQEVSVVILPAMQAYLGEFLEGFLLSDYNFDLFKNGKKPTTPKTLTLIVEEKSKEIEAVVDRTEAICDAVNFVKDMVNGPPNMVDANYLASEARRIAKEGKCKLTVFNNKELKKLGFGGLLAVNQGAKKDAKCLVLEYFGAKSKNEKPIVFVGKGVIFDTGGYNLKPTNSIETMQQDMAGAATVLGLMSILRKLGIKKNVIALTPIAENMISDTAYLPSAIIRMFNGKTVEITNTDAEGRLILADAISYSHKFKPEAIVTIATLTGAVSVALGDRHAGLIGNNFKLENGIQRAGNEVDEMGWRLPLIKDHKDKFRSQVADLLNCDKGTSRMAGSSKGAAFLSYFIGKHPWCHIDIGGTAFTNDPKPYEQKGATAHGLRMLARFLETL